MSNECSSLEKEIISSSGRYSSLPTRITLILSDEVNAGKARKKRIVRIEQGLSLAFKTVPRVGLDRHDPAEDIEQDDQKY
jgi:hypothetical protein